MPEQQQLSKDTKMAMTSQFLGFMLDAYDMALVLVMAPILGKFLFHPRAAQPGNTLSSYLLIPLRWRRGRWDRQYSDVSPTK